VNSTDLSPIALSPSLYLYFIFTDVPSTHIYTLSLHDALPISSKLFWRTSEITPTMTPGFLLQQSTSFPIGFWSTAATKIPASSRSEEHTSELQSPYDLVCRLLLEKKKINKEYSK